MDMILIEKFQGRPIAEHNVEIVERKGKGHPDYICDAIMDAISVALSREYLKQVATILHHNIDKGMLLAHHARKAFGKGRLIKPMELIIGDRGTFRAAGSEIPVADITLETAKDWLSKNLRFVNPDAHVKFRVVLAEGSEELTYIFARPGQIRGANDTSAAVGYYPLSLTERALLGLERHLNSEAFKVHFPETGEDVKVMGLRRGMSLDVTVAMPLLGRYIDSEREYFLRKKVIHERMTAFLVDSYGSDFRKITVHYNTLDVEGRGTVGTYLSVLGTSAEDADSGQVGRGTGSMG